MTHNTYPVQYCIMHAGEHMNAIFEYKTGKNSLNHYNSSGGILVHDHQSSRPYKEPSSDFTQHSLKPNPFVVWRPQSPVQQGRVGGVIVIERNSKLQPDHGKTVKTKTNTPVKTDLRCASCPTPRFTRQAFFCVIFPCSRGSDRS